MTPQDHELEAAVQGHRVGQPGASRGLVDPVRGPGGRCGLADDPLGRAALDSLQAVQVLAVEEGASTVGIIRWDVGLAQLQSAGGRYVIGKAVGQDDVGDRMAGL